MIKARYVHAWKSYNKAQHCIIIYAKTQNKEEIIATVLEYLRQKTKVQCGCGREIREHGYT